MLSGYVVANWVRRCRSASCNTCAGCSASRSVAWRICSRQLKPSAMISVSLEALRIAGSAPHYLFTRELKLPLLMFGLGHGGGAHSKDEYLVIDASPPGRGLAFLERSFVDFLYRFANS